MPTLRSSVLVAGHPSPESFLFGADFCSDFAEAEQLLRNWKYAVFVFAPPQTESADFTRFFKSLKNHVFLHTILLEEPASAPFLNQMLLDFVPFRLIKNFRDPNLGLAVQEALESAQKSNQDSALLTLLTEQNKELTRLHQMLEDRVNERKTTLTEMKERLLLTTKNYELLHQSFMALQRARSVSEIEGSLSQILKESLQISWIRIQLAGFPHSPLSKFLSVNSVYRAPLFRDRLRMGEVIFGFSEEKSILKDEQNFLKQVAEAIALALSTLLKFKEIENLKHQWEATFDAVSSPVSVIDQNYRLLRVNRGFLNTSQTPDGLDGLDGESSTGQLCYSVLFGRDQPCKDCRLGQKFRLYSGQQKIFDVLSQALHLPEKEEKTYLHIYQDISEQTRLERQIVESSKMSDLGLIGSSIAHELNNPLGGLLNFIQLIKMDLKGDETYFEDIHEMELGAHKCRDIVQNLLLFIRQQDPKDIKLFDFILPIEQAIKITEVQTRPLGITLTVKKFGASFEVEGPIAILAQFFQSLLSFISKKIRFSPQAQRKEIDVTLSQVPEGIAVAVTTYIDFLKHSEAEADTQFLSYLSDKATGLGGHFQVNEGLETVTFSLVYPAKRP